MTPEQLDEIRAWREYGLVSMHVGDAVDGLLEYIDLLHEDLRITREERDAEKEKNMQSAKDHAADIRAWHEASTTGRADAWNEGYNVGCNDGWHDDYTGTTNPYRKDAK